MVDFRHSETLVGDLTKELKQRKYKYSQSTLKNTTRIIFEIKNFTTREKYVLYIFFSKSNTVYVHQKRGPQSLRGSLTITFRSEKCVKILL